MNKSFGEKVRETRIKAGFSQQQLADKLGWNQNKIWRLERGHKKPVDLDTARNIATALGYPLSEISEEYSEDHVPETKRKLIPTEALKILDKSLPNEIPVFLQSKFININDKNYWSMEFATPKGITKFDLERRNDILGIIMEAYYDLPNFDITDMIIVNTSRTPREPQTAPGNFDPNYWHLYYRVFIKSKEINGFNILPGLWIGAGKVLVKPYQEKAVIFDTSEIEFIGSVTSRRIFFKDSAIESMLAEEGIMKTDGSRARIPINVEKYMNSINNRDD